MQISSEMKTKTKKSKTSNPKIIDTYPDRTRRFLRSSIIRNSSDLSTGNELRRRHAAPMTVGAMRRQPNRITPLGFGRGFIVCIALSIW